MEDELILDGVDDDLGEKFIWQQLHQAHRRHQGEGEEIEKRRGLKKAPRSCNKIINGN
jgi:hypothetical protein